MPPRWGRLFAGSLIALLVCGNLAPVVLLTSPLAVLDGSGSQGRLPDAPDRERWSGLVDAVRHLPVGARRILAGDVALSTGAFMLPYLPPMLVHAPSNGCARTIIYWHERFYIYPRAPTCAAPMTT